MAKRLFKARPPVTIAPFLITQLNCEGAVGHNPDRFFVVTRQAPPEWVVKNGKLRGMTPEHFYETLRRIAATPEETAENKDAESRVIDLDSPASEDDVLAKLGQRRSA